MKNPSAEDKVSVIRRIGIACSRLGKAGWQILAWIGNQIAEMMPIPRLRGLSFFRKAGIIFLGCFTMVFMAIALPGILGAAVFETTTEALLPAGHVDSDSPSQVEDQEEEEDIYDEAVPDNETV